MKTKTKAAVIAGTAALLITGGGLTAWKAAEHRADQAFITEQYAQLERDKAALEDSGPPAFDKEAALQECERQWWASDEAHRFWEVHSVDAKPATQVSEGLYTVSADITGTDGRKNIESGLSCSVTLKRGAWEVAPL